MKIMEGNEDIIKVYPMRWMFGENEREALWIDHKDYTQSLTPLEAHQLGTLLIKLANETDYFKGFKKD